ncbi:hypothetical protein PMAYCL1PPCAC_32327, partial [Pristionchus mayeri]
SHSFAMCVARLSSFILSVGIAFAAPVPPSSSEGVEVDVINEDVKDLKIIALIVLIAFFLGITRFAFEFYLDNKRWRCPETAPSPPNTTAC